MGKKKYWIQDAINKHHRGHLRHWAEVHHFMDKDGDINLSRAHKYAQEHHLSHMVREIDLARTLRKLRRR